MEIVMGHWTSWDDAAIVQDKQTGLFAHGDKVRRLDYKGKYFSSRGPFTVPRSEQGHRVVIRAGQSARGNQFAAKWGELLFVGSPPTLDIGRRNYKQIKEAVAANGRDPNHVIIAPSAYVICGESKSEAEDQLALTEKLTPDIDALSLLSEAMNFDFASKGMDEPFTDEELDNISGTQSMRDRVLAVSGIKNPTTRDFIKFSRRARPNKPIVRGANKVPDCRV